MTVPSGASETTLQNALNTYAGGTVCLATSGTYDFTGGTALSIPASTRLTTGVTPRATINCPQGNTSVDCVDVADSPSTAPAQIDHVSLVCSGTTPCQYGVKAGNYTTMGGALNVQGAGRFGIMMNTDTVGDIVQASTISSNATNCGAYGSTGFCGGIKSNQTSGTVVKTSTVSNNGSNGIWLDINSKGSFSITGNTTNANNGDGIRVEISCFGTVSGNTVQNNLGTGIHVLNSNNITVGTSTSSNSVTTTGGNDGITLMDNGRTVGSGGTGDGSCAGQTPPGPQPNGTHYYNFNNKANNNSVAMTAGTKDGFWTTTTDTTLTYNDSFGATTGDTYTGGLCAASDWNWSSSTSTKTALTFSGWQGKGQDTSGSCT